MNPVSPVIEGQESKETIYAKDQPQYLPLPALIMQGSQREVLTRWELTNEEKIALLSGGQIFLSMWTFGSPLQPILLRVAMPDEIKEEYGMTRSIFNPVESPNPDVEEALDEKFPAN